MKLTNLPKVIQPIREGIRVHAQVRNHSPNPHPVWLALLIKGTSCSPNNKLKLSQVT